MFLETSRKLREGNSDHNSSFDKIKEYAGHPISMMHIEPIYIALC